MATVKLTQRTVEAATRADGRAVDFLWDTAVVGFGLRLTAQRKTYVAQFRHQGRTYRIQVGGSDALKPDEAREIARKIIAAGQPPVVAPLVDQVQLQSQRTVAQLMSLFISEYVEKRHKTTTRKEERRLIETLIRPKLGDYSLRDLSRATIVAWHSSLPALISANRALAHMSKACSFAIQRGWLEANPCVGIERNKEHSKDRAFSDAELRRIGATIPTINNVVRDAICVLALTGMRSGEVLNLTAESFDPTRALITLTDSKTGRRSVALLPFAARMCKTLNMNFKHRIAASPAAFSKTVTRVIAKAAIHGASAHTFRHTLATFMAEHGDSVFQIAAMGGWKSLSMVQRYVSLHGVGEPNPTPADERIFKLLGL